MAKPKLPRQMKIGSFTWKIIKSRKNEDRFGETNYNKKVIRIFKCPTKEIEQDTVLHELFHALEEDIFEILETVKLEEGDKETELHEKKEEFFNRLLTPRMLQLLKDNPDLIKYLLG